MWDLPGPGLEPVSPALAGGFLTTAPPGKPPTCVFYPVPSFSSLASGNRPFSQPCEHQALLYLILLGGSFPQPWVVSIHSCDDQYSAYYSRGIFYRLLWCSLFSDALFCEFWPPEFPQSLSSISSTQRVLWGPTGSLPSSVAWKLNHRADLLCFLSPRYH